MNPLLPTIAILLSVCAPWAGASHAATLSPCHLPGVAHPARCGVINVPENPDRRHDRQLPIGVAVIPANHGPVLADPIVVLMGGPGEDAISAASYFMDLFGPLLRDRDLLLVDQRGTGRSGALGCELYSQVDAGRSLRDLFGLPAVDRCAQSLGRRADLTRYTYEYFASDLEHVREVLGYGTLNLFAGSYGTRAAQVYLRAYPQSVRTVFLGSVLPLDVPSPLPMARQAHQALEDLFDACAADVGCQGAFPRLRDEFAQVLASLDAGEVRVKLPGRDETASLHRGRVVEWIRARLYRPATATDIPWLIHRAYLGDWDPIAEGILANARGMDSAISLGLLFSITCSEDVAFINETDIDRETQNTFLGDYRVRQQQAACQRWPQASLPMGYRVPVRSAVPTLFVSGDRDGGAPLWFTQRVSQGFANNRQVVLRGRGHTEWGDCVQRLYGEFVRSGTVQDLDDSFCRPAPRPAFRLED